MRSGRLRDRLLLQSKTLTRDAYGGATVTWSDEATVWGSIEPLSGREWLAQQQLQSEVDVRIVIRYKTGVTTAWRVKHESRYYDILAVLNADMRDRTLTLMCCQGVTEDVGADASASYLLLEDGLSNLLLESGDRLILE